MIILFTLLFLGLVIGYLIKSKKKLLEISDKILMLSIYLLLFTIGLNIGKNDLIFRKLDELGLYALILSLSAISGTILISFLVNKFFFEKKQK